MQPRSRSVAPAAAASVLENGISTATCTHASMRFVRERRHPHMPQQKARQHAPRACWRPASRARAAPAAPRGPTASLHLGDLGAPGVPIWHRGAGRPPEQGRCALHRARGGGAHRAGRWAAAGDGAGRMQGGAAKRRRARCAFFPRRCRASSGPALQPRAGTCTWHRARQSLWSSARAARRSALRCATPPRPFCQTAKARILSSLLTVASPY